jgi:hypothetical protein
LAHNGEERDVQLRPENRVGKGSGRSTSFGIGFDEASYGGAAEFEASSEATDVHVRAQTRPDPELRLRFPASR